MIERRGLLKFLLIEAIALNILPFKKAVAADWSYQGKTGSDFWGELDPEFTTCRVGQAQSPIDIKSSAVSSFGSLELDYQDTPLRMINNDRTIRVDYQPGSNLTLDGQKYDLLQFHFHQPSEHLISGQAFEMEAHFVHRNQATGDLVVLAVLMSAGEINQALNTVWDNIPFQTNRQAEVSDLIINGSNLLPENINQYYRYQGSLTTPPCSEIVTWLVLKQPVQVSKLQIARFLEVIGSNARPIQALNKRKISTSSN